MWGGSPFSPFYNRRNFWPSRIVTCAEAFVGRAEGGRRTGRKACARWAHGGELAIASQRGPRSSRDGTRSSPSRLNRSRQIAARAHAACVMGTCNSSVLLSGPCAVGCAYGALPVIMRASPVPAGLRLTSSLRCPVMPACHGGWDVPSFPPIV